MTGRQRKQHNEELHKLHNDELFTKTTMMESRRQTGGICGMYEGGWNVNKILTAQHEAKRSPGHRHTIVFKWILRKQLKEVHWLHLIHNRIK
jgi:hypothetical protein